MDVMVFTPVADPDVGVLEPETAAAVLALEWDGPLTWVVQRDNPLSAADRRAGVKNHWHQYRRGRELFLQSQCEAMLVIEADIVPPADALQRLAALDVDLAYGCYMFRVSPVVNVFERYQAGAMNVGESLTVRGKWPWALQQGVVECSGAGLGIVLIKRHVLEAVDFRITGLETSPVHCDTWFTNDVYQADYSMMADTRVLCGHKRRDGTIIWPPGRAS